MNNYEKITESINKGENVFITGSAGTGKSFILNELKEDYPEIIVTASTGAAAVNVGGITIHSFAGIGIGDTPINVLYDKLQYTQKFQEIRSVKMLAIDEISMLNDRIFDMINDLFKLIREDQSPFGGVQIIVIGDFLQLPPIQGLNEDDYCDFAFMSSAWREANFKNFILTKVYRQEDEQFLSVLNRIRYGNILEEDCKMLTVNDLGEEGVVHLYARNKSADAFNSKKLNDLQGRVFCYYATDVGENKYLSLIDKYCLAPRHLFLKKGARVMLLVNKNFERGLINGSTGVVMDLDQEGVNVLFDNGESLYLVYEKLHPIKKGGVELASRTQVPLRLAWAISIHKSQGMTLERVKVDMNGVFEFGQAYVALSRAKSIQGLSLLNFDKELIKAHPKAVDFIESLITKGNTYVDQ